MNGHALLAVLLIGVFATAAAGQSGDAPPTVATGLALLPQSIDYVDYQPMVTVELSGRDTAILLDLYASEVVVHALDAGGERRIGRAGAGPGEFRVVFDVAVDSLGHIFVVDNRLARLSQFTAGGAFVRSYSLPGFSNSVIAGGGAVYVDWFPAYGEDEEKIAVVGRVDPHAGEVEPLFKLVDAAPDLFRGHAGLPETLWRPMSVDPSGRIVATGLYAYRVAVLTPKGRLVRSLEADERLEYPTEAEVSAHEQQARSAYRNASVPPELIEESLQEYRRRPKPFFHPHGIAVDAAHGIWAATLRSARGDSSWIDYIPRAAEGIRSFVVRDRVVALAIYEDRLAVLVERLGAGALGRFGLDLYRVQWSTR